MAYSVDLRKRIVAGVLEQGLSIGEAAKVFGVGSATVERYLRRFRESGELTPRTSPGRPRLLDAAQEERLRQQLGQNNDLSLKVCCARWHEASGVVLSEATMCRASKRLGVTRKKTLSASEQNPEVRLLWLADVLKLEATRLVFVERAVSSST